MGLSETRGVWHLRLERSGDGILHLTNLQLFSPKLRLSGNGIRLRDGPFHIQASGRRAKHGPGTFVPDGPAHRAQRRL